MLRRGFGVDEGDQGDIFGVGIRFSEPLNIREFPDADASPGAPKIDHHHLSEVGLGGHVLPLQVFQGEG